MAKILYGICGEGMGHALRSTAVLEHLKKEHDVVILSSSRALNHLKNRFDNVYEIHGFHLEYENNEVKSFASFIDNTAKLPSGIVQSLKQIRGIIKNFCPDLCITDFEPFTCNTAWRRDIPCISLDNNHAVTETRIEYDKKFLTEFLMTQTVTNYMVPEADYYLITSFFFPEPKNPKNTFLFPPIMRKNLLDLKSKTDKSKDTHVFVYQTSKSNQSLLDILKYVDETFVIYGFGEKPQDENCIFKPFGHKDFYSDILNAKAVVTNGGFSLMSEAVFLGKPVFAVPVKKQFEQILNATYLERQGFGYFTEKATFTDLIRFLGRLPEYKSNLSRVRFTGNDLIFKKLDELIADL